MCRKKQDVKTGLAKAIDNVVQNKYNNSTKKGSGVMSITATELKNNLGKYLLLSATEDVFITKDADIEAAKEERLFSLEGCI